MAKREAAQFVNTVIYQVDKSSLKKVRDTNKRLQKEFEKASPMSGGRRGISRQKASMDAHLKLREKHLNKVAKLEERNRERSKRSAAKASKQGFDSTISGLGAGKGAGAASNTAFADMLRNEERIANAKTQARVAGERKANRAAEAEARRAAKRKEKADIFVQEKLGHLPKTRREALRQDLLREKSNARLNQTMRSILKKEKERTKQLRKQNAFTNRMSGSVMQLAGGFVSVFGAIEALTVVTRTGMQFEGVSKAMLVSSENAEEAKKHLAFVREEAMRLGTPLLSAQKGFAGLLAAAGDKIALEDLKTVFIGINEASAALGLSAEDQAGVILALKQMLGKGKIQADELTQQLGERLPFAMRAMAAAAVKAGLIDGSKTSQEREAALFKLMEQGKLLSHEVIPHLGRQFSLFANENDGLAQALDNNLSPAIGRAQNHFTEMQNAFFKGGWKEGLMFITNNFNDQADAIKVIFSALGGFVENILKITVGKLQLISAVLMDMANIISNPDFSILDKAKEAAKLMATGIQESFKASPIGIQFEVWKDAASSVVGSDVNPFQWATGIRGQAPYATGQAPRTIPTPYQPSPVIGGNTSPSGMPVKMEVTVRGTDGLIEVVDARVEDGMQGQFNSVLSVTGEQ